MKTKTHTYRISADKMGRKRISMKTMAEKIAKSSTYVTTCDSIVFERFSVDGRKRIKTVVWTRIDGCVFDDNENELVWTGSKT